MQYSLIFNAIKFIEKTPKVFLIFSILSVCFLSFTPNGNEEHYLQLAKQFMDPDWIPNSQNLTEYPSSRLLYQYILGFFLQFLTFEHTVFIFRLLLVIATSIPLAKIYEKLKLSNTQLLLHLPILFLLNQSLFGGSWMFISVEPKGFSYIFLLLSLHYFLSHDKWKMTIALIIASYFHVLVGGYAFLYFILTDLFFSKEKKWLPAVGYIAVYALVMLPFALYIQSGLKVSKELSAHADWIYTYFRNPHHTTLFPSFLYFYYIHFYGIFLALIGLIFSIQNRKVYKDENAELLNNFVIFSLVATLILAFITAFDRTGTVLKFYLFRINTVSTFGLTILLTIRIYDFIKAKYHHQLSIYIVLFALLFTSKLAVPNALQWREYICRNNDRYVDEVCQFIKNNTEQGDVIFSQIKNLTITRKSQRDRFVIYKFVPVEISKIPDWYERVLTKKKVIEDIDLLPSASEKYRIDYFLTDQEIKNKKYLRSVYSNDRYYLFQIIPTSSKKIKTN